MTHSAFAQPAVSHLLGAVPVADLGQGYDSFAASSRSTAVKGVVKKTGAVSRLKYTVCRGASGFAEAINISTDISAGVELIDSVSVKSSLYASLQLTETSVSVVVYASHAEGSEYTSVALNAPAPAQETAAAFFQSYGDSYVSEIETGGEFIAVYTFYAETFQAQLALTMQLSANGISEAGEIDANFAAAVKATYYNNKSRKSLKTLLTGYTGKTAPGTVDEIINFAREIWGQPASEPTVLRYGVSGYEHVPGFPSEAWFEITQNRDLLNKGSRSLAASGAKLQLLRNKISNILNIYEIYGVEVDAAVLTPKLQAVDDHIDQLKDTIGKIDQFPTVLQEAPDFPPLEWGTPAVNYSQIALPQWGGTGGGDFADVTFEDVLSGTRVTSIQLKGNRAVDQIVASYASAEGAAQTFAHGGGGGGFGPKLEIQRGARVLKISGTEAWFNDVYVVTSLSFVVERGLELTYPPSTVGGKAFEHSFAADESLVGFSGRAAQYLDQIRPVIVKFAAVNWVHKPAV